MIRCVLLGLLGLMAVGCTWPEPAAMVPPPIVVAPRVAPAEVSANRDAAPSLPSDAGAFRKCAACHSLEPGRNGIGPSLAGIVGRAAASDPQFRYSEQLKGAGLTWDPATLDRFVSDPRATVPGTKMVFRGLSDPAQRAQVIAFLQRH